MKTYQLTATSPEGRQVTLICNENEKVSVLAWLTYIHTIGWTAHVMLLSEVA